MKLLKSPWIEAFCDLAVEAQSRLTLVSPFVTEYPLRLLSDSLQGRGDLRVDVLTNFAVASMESGATDPGALADFCGGLSREVSVRHLPGLHAKVYVADSRRAIVTSANLTQGGLAGNYEYGVMIEDADVVAALVEDVRTYASLGFPVSDDNLHELARRARLLQTGRQRVFESGEAKDLQSLVNELEGAREELMRLRAASGESVNSIFSRTILYLLASTPLSTYELNARVEGIHPDLCDNSIDRVINGMRFGKRWKHMVRNAQQHLRRHLLIERGADGLWRLAQKPGGPQAD